GFSGFWHIFLSVNFGKKNWTILPKIGRSAKSANFFSNFTDKQNVPNNMGTRCFGGSPPAPKHPPMLRACGLVCFRRGGACSSPPFLTCRAACSNKGLVWIL
ncbi:unnamed protein product, partial [Staurois parvus]